MGIKMQLVDKELLNRCPFCGCEKPKVIFTDLELFNDLFYRKAKIECPKCGCSTKWFDQMIKFDNDIYDITIDDIGDLIKAWNMRGGVYDGSD